MRLIQLHLAMIYFDTAVLKCHGSTWLSGTVLHYVLNNYEVTRLDFTWLSSYPSVLNLMSHATLALEFALPFLLWFRPTRRSVIAGGSKTLNTSRCAFSISSSRTTEYGRRRTASVSRPPSS
jgi:hypothetical protein